MSQSKAISSSQNASMSTTKLILITGLLAGFMDGSAAMIQTAMAGRTQEGLFRYIASGLFGNDAFSGSSIMIFYGVIFHLMIAMTWTIVFYFAYPSLKQWFKNPLLIAFVYGLIVWTVMNRIVLPLANTPKGTFDLTKAIIAALVLIVCIGLPNALMFKRYYKV
jgi:hypothetical protein